ncbi:MAG: carbohydrate ABC transporter substrate-binding protein, partial [Actinomycetota bacterium]|nr:carbohydrate ABC transporter substrate-binding protein [Actinomycetota bacterium]
RPEFLAGGPDRALIQQFPDAVLEVFRFHRAAMVVAPDFAESVIRSFGVPEDEVDTFTFPSRSDRAAPVVVKGDLLVLTHPVSDQAIDILRHLASAEAPLPWIQHVGGFIAANPRTPREHYSPTLGKLAEELFDRGREIRFDLSDQLGVVGGREGLQLAVQDFLQALGAEISPGRAADTAMRHMVAIEKRAR